LSDPTTPTTPPANDGKRRGSLVLDEELEGMAAMARILSRFSPGARRRMIGYLGERFVMDGPDKNDNDVDPDEEAASPAYGRPRLPVDEEPAF
jgi:hypothetical protein